METKQSFEVVCTTVYQLEFDSWRKGEAQLRNRVWANVQGYRDTPVEELEATARLFSAAPDMLEALKMILADDDCLLQCDALYKASKAIAKAQGEAE
jgi:hypothetical protein